MRGLVQVIGTQLADVSAGPNSSATFSLLALQGNPFPANFLRAGMQIDMLLRGQFGNDGINALNWHPVIGGSFGQIEAVTFLNTAQSYWEFEMSVGIRTDGASGSMVGAGRMLWWDPGASERGSGAVASIARFLSLTPDFINTTIANPINFTAAFGSASANSYITCTNAIVTVSEP